MAAKKTANKAPQSNKGAKARGAAPSAARGSPAASKTPGPSPKRGAAPQTAGATKAGRPVAPATAAERTKPGVRAKPAATAAPQPSAAASGKRRTASARGQSRPAAGAAEARAGSAAESVRPQGRSKAGAVPSALPKRKPGQKSKAAPLANLLAKEDPRNTAPALAQAKGRPAPTVSRSPRTPEAPDEREARSKPQALRQAEELDGEQAAWEAGQREVDEERRLAAELGEASEDDEDEAPEEALLPTAGTRANLLAQAAGPSLRPRRAPPGSPIEPLQRTDGLGLLSLEDVWNEYQAEVQRLRSAAAASGEASEASPRLQDLRNELIERHYPLVRYHAERLLQTLPKSIELDDLISAGQFGLMDAIRGFDPERGIKFKTYCSTRIRGAIVDMLRSQDWVPRLVRLKASRIEKALQKLTGEYGREPTHAELARYLAMEPTQLSQEMSESQPRTIVSLSEKWDDEDGAVEKVEIIEDRDAVDPVNELNRRDQMLMITKSLSYKERFIIEQYYQYGHTMREIGEMLGLTESRVCQIHSNVMGRLKDLLEKRDEDISP